MSCNNPIELGNSVVTYCVLPAKHKGRCEPEKPPCSNCTALERWWKKNGGLYLLYLSTPGDKGCQEISPHDGKICGFPAGHFPSYQHGAGVNRKSW